MPTDVKSFFKKTLFFLALPLGLLAAAFAVVGQRATGDFEKTAVPAGVTTVFAGDSHVEQCVDDRIVPHSLNIAQNSEAFYFTYFKLEKLLANSPAVRTVYLGFGPHSLSDYYDDFVFGQYAPYISAKYFFTMPADEKLRFLRCNWENLSLFLRNTLRSAAENGHRGGFTNIFRNTAAAPKSMDKRMKFQYFRDGKLDGFSSLNLDSFDKIARLCRERGVELVLMNTPLHPYYKERLPAEYLKKYGEVVAQYGLRVEDFNDLSLPDSGFIPDGDHVSAEGAEAVSRHLADQFANKQPNQY